MQEEALGGEKARSPSGREGFFAESAVPARRWKRARYGFSSIPAAKWNS